MLSCIMEQMSLAVIRFQKSQKSNLRILNTRTFKKSVRNVELTEQMKTENVGHLAPEKYDDVVTVPSFGFENNKELSENKGNKSYVQYLNIKENKKEEVPFDYDDVAANMDREFESYTTLSGDRERENFYQSLKS